jgi:hypothetical protein
MHRSASGRKIPASPDITVPIGISAMRAISLSERSSSSGDTPCRVAHTASPTVLFLQEAEGRQSHAPATYWMDSRRGLSSTDTRLCDFVRRPIGGPSRSSDDRNFALTDSISSVRRCGDWILPLDACIAGVQ